MGLFRRKSETYNERLLREAGLDPAQVLGDAPPRPAPFEPPKSMLSSLALPHDRQLGPNEWDAVRTATAPGLSGDKVEFITLPNGDVIIEQEQGDGDVSPLADAVETKLEPPYKAAAARQSGDLWGVAAKQIDVAKIPFTDGQKLALTQHGRECELQVDGELNDGPVPLQLEALGQALGADFYVEAERIDGDFWEVRATAL